MKKYKVLTEKEMKQTVGGGWTDFSEGLLVGFPPKRTDINNDVYKNIVKCFAKPSTVVERIVCIL